MEASAPIECKANSIKLAIEQEKIVKDELESRHFPRQFEEVTGEVLRILREKDQTSGTCTPNGEQRKAYRPCCDREGLGRG